MTVAAARHLVAVFAAAGVVFGAHLQDIDLQPLLGAFDQSSFDTFTPYFPGLDQLGTHEIFAPWNRSKKKIVFLGASAVDSIGCDYTWERPDPNQAPNAHYSCSIAGQLNELLKKDHLDEWQAFDLARNGTKLTPELYTYARIQELKPEIVIYGDSFPYYMEENADANALNPAHYAYIDHLFNAHTETADLWRAYKLNLQRHGWTPVASVESPPDIDLGPKRRASTDLSDLISQAVILLKSHLPYAGMPRPVAYSPSYRIWEKPASSSSPFQSPDLNLDYFKGVQLIAAMQRLSGDKTFFFFCPQWERSDDLSYQKGLEDVYGAFLHAESIPYASYVPMRMQPVTETFDGYHHTLAGNHRIAAALLHDLQLAKLIP